MCPPPPLTSQSQAPGLRGGGKTVALTFDDGPGRSTQAIIDILESFHVRATFFNVGQEEVYQPNLVAEEARDGFLLGDHTVDHPVMAGLSEATQTEEIAGVLTETRLIAQTSPCVFRPPYGSYDAATVDAAGRERMSFWLWNVSTDDWMARGSGSTYWIHHIISVAESMGLATDHAVVLFHNQPILMPATVAALPVVISFFQSHGYRFVDLLGRTGSPGSCGPPGSVPAAPAGVALPAGSQLRSGARLDSPSGQFSLVMRADGDLVVRLGTGRTLWSTRTSGNRGSHLQVGFDGDVRVIAPNGRAIWSSQTFGHAGARLVVRDDGVLAVELGRTVLWQSGPPLARLLRGERLLPGWRLTSPDGRCRLIEPLSGRPTVLDSTGQVLWSTWVPSTPGSMLVLLAGGGLVNIDPPLPPSWRSGTGIDGPTQLTLQNSGQLSIVTMDGECLWLTP